MGGLAAKRNDKNTYVIVKVTGPDAKEYRLGTLDAHTNSSPNLQRKDQVMYPGRFVGDTE